MESVLFSHLNILVTRRGVTENSSDLGHFILASREPGSQFVHQLEARDPGPSLEPRIVVLADFDDLPDHIFVRSQRIFDLLIESVQLHLI